MKGYVSLQREIELAFFWSSMSWGSVRSKSKSVKSSCQHLQCLSGKPLLELLPNLKAQDKSIGPSKLTCVCPTFGKDITLTKKKQTRFEVNKYPPIWPYKKAYLASKLCDTNCGNHLENPIRYLESIKSTYKNKDTWKSCGKRRLCESTPANTFKGSETQCAITLHLWE